MKKYRVTGTASVLCSMIVSAKKRGRSIGNCERNIWKYNIFCWARQFGLPDRSDYGR